MPPNSLELERRSPTYTVPPTRLLGQPKGAKVWPSTTLLFSYLNDFSMNCDDIYLLAEPNFRTCFLIPLRPWVSPPNSLEPERRSPTHTVPPTRLLGQPKEAKVWPSTTLLVTAPHAPKNGQL